MDIGQPTISPRLLTTYTLFSLGLFSVFQQLYQRSRGAALLRFWIDQLTVAPSAVLISWLTPDATLLGNFLQPLVPMFSLISTAALLQRRYALPFSCSPLPRPGPSSCRMFRSSWWERLRIWCWRTRRRPSECFTVVDLDETPQRRLAAYPLPTPIRPISTGIVWVTLAIWTTTTIKCRMGGNLPTG